jgi:hypothetical protein
VNGDEPQGFKFDKTVLRMVFDAVLALVVAVVGYTVNGIHKDIDSIKARDDLHDIALASLRERLPIEYVRMDMYMRDRQEMRAILDRIDTNVREHRERQQEFEKRSH